MNVMLVVPWDQTYGGVASVVGNLARSLEGRGHQVVFLHPGEPDRCRRRMTAWGFTGYEVNLRSPYIREHPVKSVIAFVVYFGWTMYQIAAVIRAHGIQVINVHYPIEAFVYFGVLRWLLPIRLAVSVHGADVFPDGRRMHRYPWSLRFLVGSADALVASSRAFLLDCLSVFARAGSKGVVVHNGVDVEELWRTGAGIDTTKWEPYLLCIAAHNEKKALDVLLKAFAEVSRRHPRLHLLLAGDGPLRARYEEETRLLSLGGRVVFLGWRGRSEITRLLQACTMLVLPSRSEPFGMVVAEAQASRKAVVASAVGGVPEIIEHGRSGLLVPPDDPDALARALMTVLDSDTLRESMADAGYERVRSLFGRERMGSRYESLYCSLFAGGVAASA